MVKKEQSDKTSQYLLIIVGIVAIVGFVSLLANSGATLVGAATSSTCSDTDGGLVYTTKGTISGGLWKTTNLAYTNKIDSCVLTGTNKGKLLEGFCPDSTHGFYVYKSCATVIGAGSVCSAGACTPLTDSDGDGVYDASDKCPGYDDKVDTDSDGTPDGCDTDDDGDGYSDADETAAGTDPLDASDYPSASEIVVVGSHDGYLYVLNAEDGSLVEKLDVTDASEYHGGVTQDILYITPAVGLYAYDIDDFSSVGSDTGGSYVYDSGGLSYFEGDTIGSDYYIYVGSTADRVIAINLNSAEKYWQYDAGQEEDFNKPALLGSTLYAAGKSGTVYALDTTNIISGPYASRTDDDYPDTLWTYDVDATGTDNLAGPVVGDDVYVADDSGYVYALDKDDGTLLWQEKVTNKKIYALSPVITIRLSGSLSSTDVLFVSAANSVFALDADTGDVLWEYATGDLVQSEVQHAFISSGVSPGVVFFGSDDGYIYAVNADDGSLLWKYAAGEDVNGDSYIVSVGTLGSVLYIGGESGTVFALDADDGTKLWTYSTGSYVRGRPIYYSYD